MTLPLYFIKLFRLLYTTYNANHCDLFPVCRYPIREVLHGIDLDLESRALYRHSRGHGFESPSSLNFFQAFFSQPLKLRTNCEDFSSI